MKMQDVKEIAKKNGVKAGKMRKTDLVLAIQKAEGNCECFATPYVSECNQVNCLWRADCSVVQLIRVIVGKEMPGDNARGVERSIKHMSATWQKASGVVRRERSLKPGKSI